MIATAFYVVKKGDTLWSIAARQLGDPNRWPELYECNNKKNSRFDTYIVNPDLILVDQKLHIPGTGAATEEVIKSVPPETREPRPLTGPKPEVGPINIKPLTPAAPLRLKVKIEAPMIEYPPVITPIFTIQVTLSAEVEIEEVGYSAAANNLEIAFTPDSDSLKTKLKTRHTAAFQEVVTKLVPTIERKGDEIRLTCPLMMESKTEFLTTKAKFTPPNRFKIEWEPSRPIEGKTRLKTGADYLYSANFSGEADIIMHPPFSPPPLLPVREGFNAPEPQPGTESWIYTIPALAKAMEVLIRIPKYANPCFFLLSGDLYGHELRCLKDRMECKDHRSPLL